MLGPRILVASYANRVQFPSNALQFEHSGMRRKSCSFRGRAVVRTSSLKCIAHLGVFAVSDLHTHYQENLEWVKCLPRHSQPGTVLLVAGDVSDDLRVVRDTLSILCEAFEHVFFVPGNHELWVKGDDSKNAGAKDSVEKLQAVLGLCEELGVHVTPKQIGAVWIVPLFAWHHKTFDKEPDIPGIPGATNWTIADYTACKWPEDVSGPGSGHEQLAAWFDELNDPADGPLTWKQLVDRTRGCDVITFSHFVPSQCLLPEKRFMQFPNLAKVSGSDFLMTRIKQLRPVIHVFAHTHFAWDAVVEGVRCVQVPLCYPAERRRRGITIDLQDPWLQTSNAELRELAAEHVNPSTPWLPMLIYTTSHTESAECTARGDAGVCEVKPSLLDVQRNGKSSVADGPAMWWQSSTLGSESEQAGNRANITQDECTAVTGEHAATVPPLHGVCSDYYATHERQPQNLELAPWIAAKYAKSQARRASKT